MTQNEADSLKACNGMGDIGHGEWVPFQKAENGLYYSPNGLRVLPPFRWRSLTHPEVVAEMNSRNEVPIT